MANINENKEAYQMMKNALGSIENRFREAYNKGYKDGLRDGASQVTAKLVSKILEEAEADTPQTDLVEDSPSLVKDLVKAFCEDGTWLERQGVYTLTLAEAKQRAVDIIEAVSRKDTADTPQTESTGSPIGDYRDGVGAWQTDCGWK